MGSPSHALTRPTLKVARASGWSADLCSLATLIPGKHHGCHVVAPTGRDSGIDEPCGGVRVPDQFGKLTVGELVSLSRVRQ
jgi:hypothetical protein